HLHTCGIELHVSCPGTPEQNGTAERKHRHIVEIGLTMMFHANIPLPLWVEVFLTAVYLINRLPLSTLNNETPYFKLFKRHPQYSGLRVIGCQCFPSLRYQGKNKFSAKTYPCVFIGYSPMHKGYRCLDPKTKRVYISRHVVFDETTFPFKPSSVVVSPPNLELTEFPNVDEWFDSKLCATLSTSSSSQLVDSTLEANKDLPTDQSIPYDANTFLFCDQNCFTGPCAHPSQNQEEGPGAHPIHNQEIGDHIQTEQQSQEVVPEQQLPMVESELNQTETTSTIELRRSSRPRRPPSYLKDCVSLATESPKQYSEPKTLKSALKDPLWVNAMQEEICALHSNKTWELVPRPTNANVVGSKWVYRIKFKEDGSIDRFKARLVAKGFTQVPGIDFDETFSPVVKHTTIRFVIALSLSLNWSMRQLDVKNAFLHGKIKETVFMEQPPGFVNPKTPNHVCLLKKSLYGLKQAPRAWFDRLSTFLLHHGFICSKADSSLFILKTSSVTTLILIYVDDILVAGNNDLFITNLVQQLGREFAIKDLGPLHYFLGVEFIRFKDGLFLTQQKYTNDLLLKTKMLGCKSIATPQILKEKSSSSDDIIVDATEFRSIVGALQYLTFTRPDITHAVNRACQHFSKPTMTDLKAVKRILRYLRGTQNWGLRYLNNTPHSLYGFSDADWAGCPVTRRSTTGYCVFLGANCISWSSKKQPTVARSSTEAEYRSMAHTTAELTWITYLLQDIDVSLPRAPQLFCDNISALHMSVNPVFHARTKHIELDYHFVREKVAMGALVTRYTPTSSQIADVFTKPLAKDSFFKFRSKLGVYPSPPTSLRGYDKEPNQNQLIGVDSMINKDEKSAKREDIRIATNENKSLK
ncbi:putative copia-type protein, partial [Trifolium pratense]